MVKKVIAAIGLSGCCLLAAAQNNPVIIQRDIKQAETHDLKVNPNIAPKLKLGYFFSDDAVKVIVLMHGITGDVIDTDPPTTGYYTSANRANTIKHVKAYFGYHFVMKMLGYNGSIITNPEQARNSSNFPTIETLSGQVMRNPGDFYTKANNDNSIGDHIYRLTTANSREKIYVMLVPRDGTIQMMRQANDAADKIVDYYKELEKTAGSKLQLYLVCHSGGGIVARMLMKPNIRFDGATLDEEKASFVRDRTVCVTTVSTPHEGSPLPSKIIAVKNDAATADAAKSKIISFLPFFRDAPDFSLPGLARNFSFLDFVTAIPSFEIRASRDNMAREFMLEFNNGEGDPKYALRTDGTKIPFYCFGGRRPAGPYYTSISQDIFGGIPQFYIRRGASVEILDKMQVMYILGIPAAHYILHVIDAPLSNEPMNWGAVPAGQAAKFDRVKWGGKTAQGTFQPYTFSNSSTTVLPVIYFLDGTDGETDTDGFVDYASAVGYKMGKGENEYFDHTKGGSFYRIYDGPFELHNHGTIIQDQTVAQFITDNIIRVAGPYPQIAGTASTWTK